MKSFKTGVFCSLVLLSNLIFAQPIPVANEQYHYYGPNSQGEYLQVGGSGRVTNSAAVTVTNGNLHLDSKSGNYGIYLNYYSQNNTLINTNGGNVGIGCYSPPTKLQVNSANPGNGTNDWIAGNFGGQAGDRVVMGILKGTAAIGAHTNALNSWATLAINPDGGNVAVGTTDPHGYKLAVAGSMIAESVRVMVQSTWPDYVFAKEYVLPELKSLDDHIKENGRLPDIPSAADAEKEGVDLGDMNIRLLKKVEELTLYLIDQNKKLILQSEKLDAQDKINDELRKEISQLKTKL